MNFEEVIAGVWHDGEAEAFEKVAVFDNKVRAAKEYIQKFTDQILSVVGTEESESVAEALREIANEYEETFGGDEEE